jgi:CubicO group peptidase (beta-lactamase class C family)
MALPSTFDVLNEGVRKREHLGAQIYIDHRSHVISEGLGDCMPSAALLPETIMLWMSAGKPVTAVAIMQQIEQGRCDLDDPVASYIPEFGVHGKEAITIRHLLTHTAGIRGADMASKSPDWGETLAAVCATRPEPRWVPGEKAGYHVEGTWHLLGELVQRMDGRKLKPYIMEEIFVPLDVPDAGLGLSDEEQRTYGGRIGQVFDTATSPMQALAAYNRPDRLRWLRPGANMRGPARALGRFYRMLIDGGLSKGGRLLAASSVEQMCRRERVAMFDHSFQHRMDWGLGFCINSRRYGVETVPYGYGSFASEETFGHAGRQTGTAFADPAHDLVVVVLLNGMPGEAAHHIRMRRICDAIYTDLGLTHPPKA